MHKGCLQLARNGPLDQSVCKCGAWEQSKLLMSKLHSGLSMKCRLHIVESDLIIIIKISLIKLPFWMDIGWEWDVEKRGIFLFSPLPLISSISGPHT